MTSYPLICIRYLNKVKIYDFKPCDWTTHFFWSSNFKCDCLKDLLFPWIHDKIIFEIYLLCFEVGRIGSFCYFSSYLILLLLVFRKNCAYSAWRRDIKELVSCRNCVTSCCLAEFTFWILRELLFFFVWLSLLLHIQKVPASDLGPIPS